MLHQSGFAVRATRGKAAWGSSEAVKPRPSKSFVTAFSLSKHTDLGFVKLSNFCGRRRRGGASAERRLRTAAKIEDLEGPNESQSRPEQAPNTPRTRSE